MAICMDNLTINTSFYRLLLNHLDYGHFHEIRCFVDILTLASESALETIDEKIGTLRDLDLVKKVRRSTLRHYKFARHCETCRISNLMVILDVETRWIITYEVHKRAIILKQPLLMISTEEEFTCYHLCLAHCTEFDKYKNFLEVFCDVTVMISSESSVALSQVVSYFNVLLDHIESFATHRNHTVQDTENRLKSSWLCFIRKHQMCTQSLLFGILDWMIIITHMILPLMLFRSPK